MTMWMLLHPKMTAEHLGLLPGMLDESDPRPAREQFDANYQHGGGWQPLNGHTLHENNVMTYPGDPPFKPVAVTYLRDEMILLYDYAFVAIVQPDRSYEVARMD